MEILNSESNPSVDDLRPIERVKKVIDWLEWQEFTIPDLIDGIEAHGFKKVNAGGLKVGIITALLRTGYIEEVKGRIYPTYQQANRPPLPAPEPKKTDSDSVRSTAKKVRLYQSSRPFLMEELITASHPLSIEQLKNRIKKRLNIDVPNHAVYSIVTQYDPKGWIEKHALPGATRSKGYALTPRFYIENEGKLQSICEKSPKMADEIEAAFARVLSPSNQTQPAPEKDDADQGAPAQSPNAPIDWELPENYISAADVGAAIIERIRRLEMNQVEKFTVKEVDGKINKMQYRIDELASRLASAVAKSNEKDRTIRNLNRELKTIGKDYQELQTQARELQIKLNKMDPRTIKKSFKMSELTHLNRLFSGPSTEEKDNLNFDAVEAV